MNLSHIPEAPSKHIPSPAQSAATHQNEGTSQPRERAEAAERARIAKAENDRKLKEIADAAEKQRLADEEAARIAAALPDREKLTAFAQRIRVNLGHGLPSFSPPHGPAIRFELSKRIEDLALYCEAMAKELSKPKKGQPKTKEGDLL